MILEEIYKTREYLLFIPGVLWLVIEVVIIVGAGVRVKSAFSCRFSLTRQRMTDTG